MHSRKRYNEHKNMIKKKAYTKIKLVHCYVERYKIIETPINSNKFTEFDMKK